MIEEPYRWVEAVANRREYIETQLAEGRPIVAAGCAEGIVFVTLGSVRQKLFEIYDRIAMGAIGHPGDIERLRMAVIELASTEGFTRSAADVSLRRLAYYSLSPMLKGAFEQIYGAPFLARMLFAELGESAAQDLFLRVEYDGAIASNGPTLSDRRQDFGVLSGAPASAAAMEDFLKREHNPDASLTQTLRTALNACAVGTMSPGEGATRALPANEAIDAEREKQADSGGLEAILLERTTRSAIRYRPLTAAEIQSARQA